MNSAAVCDVRWSRIVLMTVAALAAGCSRPSGETPTAGQPSSAAQAPATPATGTLTGTIADLGGPEWKLESFDTSDPVPSEVQITLAVGGQHLSGRGGCNRYMGSIKDGEAPGAISVGPLATTKMACPAPMDAVERRYTGALQQAVSFAIENGRLLIRYRDGEQTRTLAFSRA